MNALNSMWGEIAGVLSALSAAIGSLQVRALARNVHPFAMNALRCILASIGFACLWGFGSRAIGNWGDALPLLLLAVICGLVIGDSLYFGAIVRLGSSRATPIAMSYPLPTAFFAFLIFGEPLPVQKLLGIIIGVVAIWLVATRRNGGFRSLELDRANLIGVGLACSASILWSFSILALRPALSLVPIEFANLLRMVIASLILSFISFRFIENADRIFGLTHSVALIGGLGVTAFMTSYLLAESVYYSGASVAALMSSMTPVFAAPLAWIFFREALNARLFMAIGLGILGITMVAFSS